MPLKLIGRTSCGQHCAVVIGACDWWSVVWVALCCWLIARTSYCSFSVGPVHRMAWIPSAGGSHSCHVHHMARTITASFWGLPSKKLLQHACWPCWTKPLPWAGKTPGVNVQPPIWFRVGSAKIQRMQIGGSKLQGLQATQRLKRVPLDARERWDACSTSLPANGVKTNRSLRTPRKTPFPLQVPGTEGWFLEVFR